MESKQKDKKHDPLKASEISNDQLGENTSGLESQDEIYKREHTGQDKKKK